MPRLSCPNCACDGNYQQCNVIHNYTAVKWKQLRCIAHFGIIILISAQQKSYQLPAVRTEYISLWWCWWWWGGGGWRGNNIVGGMKEWMVSAEL